ncbi:uncharacterized protein LOC135848708 [Planococcus citri]|uniref:uncharacterized protein LOC135848708 n=1 Tax=Planococcus citri TaxID=170843 RepID=UPI0031F80901
MSAENTILIVSENGDNNKNQIKKDDVFRLHEVNWMVNVTPMSDSHRDHIESRAILQLKTTNKNSPPETTVMDFKLEELSKFFQTLENIQDKLDDLVESNEANKINNSNGNDGNT